MSLPFRGDPASPRPSVALVDRGVAAWMLWCAGRKKSFQTRAARAPVVASPWGEAMLLSLAPMEGVTGHTFRRVHAECFGAIDRYYTPFLALPRVGHPFVGRSAAEVDPENNRGLAVVPQLLSKNADEFLWSARLLAEMGYREVNLNLGCPSGTVVSKGKGSGFLRDLDALDAFLGRVCDESPVPVSAKTRIGLADDAEWEGVLGVFLRHPLAELIVHPRVQRDRYQGVPRREAYGRALAAAPFPVAYNGDVFGRGDLEPCSGRTPRRAT